MKSTRNNYVKIACLLTLAICLTVIGARSAQAITAAGTVITNTATANYSDGGGNSFTATGSVSVTVEAVYYVSVACTTANQSAPSNTTVYYACTVTNTGNEDNTYALSVSATAWGAPNLYHDVGVIGTYESGIDLVSASTGVLTPASVYTILVGVNVPLNTPNGQTSTFTLVAQGSGDPGDGDRGEVSRITTAQAPALTITKKVRNVTDSGAFATSGVTAKPGEILEYQLTVTNGGATTATTVILSDPLNTNLTYVPTSLYSGSNGTDTGAPNVHNTDGPTGEICATNVCAAAKFDAGTVTFYIGNGAAENTGTGGSFPVGTTIYLYYQATVN